MTRVPPPIQLLMIIYLLVGLPNTFSQDQPLQAAFTASATEGEAPLTVVFDASPTVGAEAPKYKWFLLGGGEPNGLSAEHTFTEPGEYRIDLQVVDGADISNASQIITVTGDEPAKVLQAPYTIDEDLDFSAGPEAFVTGYGGAFLDSSMTVPVYNYNEDFSTYLKLFDNEGNRVASDWVIPGRKTRVTFGIRGSVLAEILRSYSIASWPEEHFFALYDRFPKHPRFEEAVEIIRNNGNFEIASDETFREAYGLFDLIATETARAYALEQGWVDLENGVLTFAS